MMQKVLILTGVLLIGLSSCTETNEFTPPYEVTVKRRWDNGNPSLVLEYYKLNDPSAFLKKNYDKQGALLIQESFEDYVLHGPTVHFLTSGDSLQRLDYVNGRLNGTVKVWFSTGELKSVAYYKRDTLIEMNNLYKNGQPISKVSIVAGTIQGDAEYYDSLGNVELTGTWRNNQREGEWKHYDTEGNLTAIEVYRNGQVISSRDY